jgi:hypothetical protein
MRRCAHAARPHVDFARICLRISDELRHRLGWNCRIDHHDERRAHKKRDGGDVAQKNEFELIVERRINCGRGVEHEKRIAVRTSPHDCLGCDVAAGSRPVDNNELLTEPF